MKFKIHAIAVTLLLATFLFVSSALAGPPLVCHAFDIGNAKSLPWISDGWNLTGKESYDTRNLAADTIAILDADSTVLVHMETLRRATLYANKDSVLAKQLLLKLIARVDTAPSNSSAATLAYFDAGYLAETYKQYQWISKSESNPAKGFDGYALIKKAIELRGSDPQMDFAAALITLNGPPSEHQSYAAKAIAGSKNDPLLARNLSAHFHGTQGETIAGLISSTSNVKVAKQ
jgi:hypothetical protein